MINNTTTSRFLLANDETTGGEWSTNHSPTPVTVIPTAPSATITPPARERKTEKNQQEHTTFSKPQFWAKVFAVTIFDPIFCHRRSSLSRDTFTTTTTTFDIYISGYGDGEQSLTSDLIVASLSSSNTA